MASKIVLSNNCFGERHLYTFRTYQPKMSLVSLEELETSLLRVFNGYEIGSMAFVYHIDSALIEYWKAKIHLPAGYKPEKSFDCNVRIYGLEEILRKFSSDKRLQLLPRSKLLFSLYYGTFEFRSEV